jgi:hypothetical protein
MRFLSVTVAVLGLAALAGPVGAQVDCEAARCAAQQAITAECPCDNARFSNHGRYVSCVAHVVRRLSQPGGPIPLSCRGRVKRCAARSTCGKEGFVTCLRPVDTCNLATATCTNAPTVTCATDIDCGSRCSTKRSAEICQLQGGVPGPSGSCCSACAP